MISAKGPQRVDIYNSVAGRFDLKVFVNCLQNDDKDVRVETSRPAIHIYSYVLLVK